MSERTSDAAAEQRSHDREALALALALAHLMQHQAQRLQPLPAHA